MQARSKFFNLLAAPISFSVLGLLAVFGLLTAGSALAYYYPPGNAPPGPPPNYNQVDTVYFLGTPHIPLPPPDSGGIYVYYDQGVWNVANHIYSKGNSFEQFHCCVLAVLSQPPTPGVNVFAEEFELEVPGKLEDSSKCHCLRQNDRWGWIPWGDSLYEIWWDVSTREWDAKCGGDPNDFMRFRIAGCAVDFNLWSSGHGILFGPDQVFLGESKTPLSSVPGFVDTYPGVSDPYQSQAGTNPEGDPNITVFTRKSDALRSYNKLGLIHPTDWYWCDLAWHYGERYAGSFAYEGNGVQFSTASLCPPNRDPSILITPDTTVFLCADDSVRIWILASDPDAGDVITVEKTLGIGTYVPQTGPTPISDEFYFHPDTNGVYGFIFRVTDDQGATGEDTTLVTVEFNRPPEITCPEDDSVKAGSSFSSTDYSVTDPDDPTGVTIELGGVSPSPTYTPTLVDKHVEWQSCCGDLQSGPVFTFTLIATDPCGAKDTCEFAVTVYDPLPQITPPPDDSVHAGDYFTSADFSASEDKGDPVTVSLCGITPAPTNQPTIVDNHVEWQTDCADAGKVFTICLEATDGCGGKDTGYFDVTVYNRPPELVCPDDAVIRAKDTLISIDFSFTDPDGDPAPVTFLDITPSAANDPVVVGNHVEWITTLAELGDYVIRLVATDPCGLADTCEFLVTVNEATGTFECPEDDSVHAGVLFISSYFVLTGPGAHPSQVSIAGVEPPPTNMPTILASHVEWQTACLDTGKVFTISLHAPVAGSEQDLDTCSFEVTVYNRPPQLFCPEDGGVFVADLFVSTDFRTFDPDGDWVGVSILDVDPTPCTYPYIVRNHVEWQSTCCDTGTFYVRLVGVDPCGLKDTCGFWITISDDPDPDFYFWVTPVTQYVPAGQTAEYVVELHSLFEFNSPCSLFVSGLPNPPNSADFDDPVVTPTGWTWLNVHTIGATVPGIYILTITGKEIGGPVEHDVVVFLEVLGGFSDVDDRADNPNTPNRFVLFQNQPNPFNPETDISFALPERAFVSLTVYNIQGKRVATLASGEMGAGTHTVHWNGEDEAGNSVASGVYFYRLKTKQFDQTMKMVLMK